VLPAPSEEGEYGSVLIKFVSDGQTVEPPVIEQLYDNNGTYNSGQLLVLKDGRTHNLMLSKRTLYTDGNWNTLCLPFDIDDFSGTPLDGFTVKELDTETLYDGHLTGIEGSTLYLNFKNSTRIEAGKPYIVKKSGQAIIVNPVFYNVTVTTATEEIANPYRDSYEDPEFITVAAPTAVTSTDGTVKFCGNYDPINISGGDQSMLFLGSANKLYYPSGEMQIGAFRAHFELSDGITAGVPNAKTRAFVLNFGDEEDATGIVAQPTLNSQFSILNSEWYDLGGRRLNGKPTAKGLYIHNGRKVMIK
jgi:hypothetical protein